MVLTVIPWSANSNALARLKASKAPFDPAYAESPRTREPINAAEAMLTIRPPPPECHHGSRDFAGGQKGPAPINRIHSIPLRRRPFQQEFTVLQARIVDQNPGYAESGDDLGTAAHDGCFLGEIHADRPGPVAGGHESRSFPKSLPPGRDPQ
jgi:hypothetical protein